MPLRHSVYMLVYALGMAVGQILFKMASDRTFRMPAASLSDQLVRLWLSPHFLAGICLYFLLTVLWIWLLSFIPLNKAYPFVALNFVLVPAAGVLVFSESLTLLNGIGLFLIALGIVLATR